MNQIKKLANPNTIIIKNNYYKKGLTEEDVYSYYMKHKILLLNQVKNRDVIIVINTDVNNSIFRRKLKDEYIKLNINNYNKLIHGRVVTIYSTMNQFEKIGIIDIDFHKFKQSQLTAINVFNYVNTIFKNCSIRFSGKTSFHIICEFDTIIDINDIRSKLFNILNDKFSGKYLINERRNDKIVNLDLSINKFRGAFTTLHSLSQIGLKCIDVPIKKLLSFNPEQCKI